MEGSSNESIHGVVTPEDNPHASSRKRSSIFSLTIDELEDKRGKDFGAMNMNDLLNDLWNAEGNSTTNLNAVANDGTETDPLSLSRQNTFSVPTPLFNKTLEEVWDEINRNGSPEKNPNVNIANGKSLHQGQQTLGEMTLEDFLVMVGVIQDGSALFPRPKLKESYQNSYGSLPNNRVYLGPFSGQGSMMTGLEHSQSNGENNMVVNGSTTYPVYTTSGIFAGEGSDSVEENEKCNGVPIGINKGEENRRASTDQMELALERRRRRMTKIASQLLDLGLGKMRIHVSLNMSERAEKRERNAQAYVGGIREQKEARGSERSSFDKGTSQGREAHDHEEDLKRWLVINRSE